MDGVTWTREQLAVDGSSSHLALRLAEPAAAAEPGGSERVVLYLHGFGSSQSGDKADFFRRRFMDRGLAVCSIDFQGHGESGGTMRELTLSRNLADIALAHGFLRRRGYQRIVLMGSSMGGASALWYAGRGGAGVEAVLTLAPALEMAAGMERWAGPQGVEEWRRDGFRKFSYDQSVHDLGWGLLEDLWSFELDELIAGLSCPSLILQGKLDQSVDWRAVAEFAAACERAAVELHLFGDADHRLVDRFDHLWSLVDGFLVARGLIGTEAR